MENLAGISDHLLRFSPDALIVVDEKRRILFANDTARVLFGYSPSSLIGQSLEILLPERLRTRHVEHVGAYLRAPNNREMGARIADLTARRADGSEFPAGIRLAPFELNGRSYIAAAIRDITESRQVYDSMLAAREEADRANRAKSRFLATASHDLRQPLQAVRLLNASIKKLVRDSEVGELLERQGDAIENMARLLNGLLDISRLESGTVELKVSEVSLVKLFAELKSDLEPVARARDIALDCESADLALATDRVLLRQLLENLLGNAIKYTDRGGVRMTAAMTTDALVIEIVDTGIGIPADKVTRIFDEYYQVDAHGARRAGVGLGLAIVREVARLLGFSVKIDSTVGTGTRVQVFVPVQFVVERPSPQTPRPIERKAPSPSAVHPKVVLLEDNDPVRRATELFLRLEEFDVKSAATATEAESLFTASHGDEVLVADYHLDGPRSGLDVLLDLRNSTGRIIPAVIMSGDLPAVMRTIKVPVEQCVFLGKPVDTQELIKEILKLGSISQTR